MNTRSTIAFLCLLACLQPFNAAANAGKFNRKPSIEQPNYAAFMADLQLNMNQGNTDLFEQSFYTLPIENKLRRRLHMNDAVLHQLKSDLRTSIDAMADKIVQGQIKILRVVPSASKQAKMLIRLDYGTDGLMYVQFDIMEINNTLRIVDWLNHSTGMTLSDTLEQLYTLQNSLPQEQAKSLNQLYLSVNSNQYADALATLKRLPKSLQNNPFVMLLKTEASAVDETLYMQALAEFAVRFGRDERYTWIMVDHYYYQQDFGTAHKLLDAFANRVIRDAAIYAIQGSFAYVNTDYAGAIRFCRIAMKLDPDYRDTYLTLLYALIANHNFQEAVLVLEVLQQRFSFKLDPMMLASFDGFDDFAKSEPFLDWAQKTLDNTLETGSLP